MQQITPAASAKDFVSQGQGLKALQHLGSTVSFHRHCNIAAHFLSVFLLSDAGLMYDLGHLCYIAGLLLDDLRTISVYHFYRGRGIRQSGRSSPLEPPK